MHSGNAPGRGWRRPRLSYANIVSTLALFLALAGGSAYAATKLITGKQIAPSTITAKNIKPKSLVAKDFAANQLPHGATGAQGAPGATGPQGAAGAAGATGATGAAGSAVAYASVVVNSAGNPSFVGSHVGFTNVTEPQTGVFCLSPSFKDGGGNIIGPLLTPASFNGEVALNDNQQCGGDPAGYEVVTLSGGSISAPSSGEGFIVAIP